MTTPQEKQPQQAAPVTPGVSTAPPRSRWRWGAVPARLGRARTSTVVLAVLWIAVFVLYVIVRPVPVQSQTTGGGAGGPVAPASTSPAPTASPSRTTESTTGTPASTTSASSTPTQRPTRETTSGGSSPSPTTAGPSSVPVLPSATAPAPTS
jgi:hypothetical protein